MDGDETGDSGDTVDAGGSEGAEVILTFDESRVLGCLLEKEMTTPEYYPMTLNSLQAACNQKSNRNPVTTFDEEAVEDALAGLREKKIAVMVSMAGSRVPKFKHMIESVYGSLDRPQTAILCVLLLRGAQTVGELRGRTERMTKFDDLSEVEEVLESLIDRAYGNLAKMLPPGGGRKAKTFVHLLCGDIEVADAGTSGTAGGASIADAPVVVASSGWRKELEDEVASLRSEVSLLRKELEEFKQQFS